MTMLLSSSSSSSLLQLLTIVVLATLLLRGSVEGKEVRAAATAAAFCNSNNNSPSKGILLNHHHHHDRRQYPQHQFRRHFLPTSSAPSAASSSFSLLKYKSNNDNENNNEQQQQDNNNLEKLIAKLDNVLLEEEEEHDDKTNNNNLGTMLLALEQMIEREKIRKANKAISHNNMKKTKANTHNIITPVVKKKVSASSEGAEALPTEEEEKEKSTTESKFDIEGTKENDNDNNDDDDDNEVEWWKQQIIDELMDDIDTLLKIQNSTTIDEAMTILERNDEKKRKGRKMEEQFVVVKKKASSSTTKGDDDDDDDDVGRRLTSLSSSLESSKEQPINNGVSSPTNGEVNSNYGVADDSVVVDMIEDTIVNGKVNNSNGHSVNGAMNGAGDGGINSSINGAINGGAVNGGMKGKSMGSNNNGHDVNGSSHVNGAVNGASINGLAANGSVNGSVVNGAVNGMKDTTLDSISTRDGKTAPSRDNKLAFFATPQKQKSKARTNTKSKDDEEKDEPNGRASTEEDASEETAAVVNASSKQDSVFFGSAVGNRDDNNSKDIAEMAAKIAEEEEEQQGMASTSQVESENVSKEFASATKSLSRKAKAPKPEQVTVKMERNLYRVTPSEAKKAWLDIIWKNGDGLPSLVLTLKRNSDGLHTKRLIFPSFSEESLTGGADSDNNNNNTIEYKVSRLGLFGTTDRVANSHVGVVSFEETEDGTLMKWNIKFDVSGRKAFWKRVTEIIVGSQCDSLSAYLAEPQIISNESEFPGKQPEEVMDAWMEFVWKQGGDLPFTPKPVNLGGNERAVFPMFLRERIDSVDYEKKEIAYHAENPSFVHCQEGFVQFEYDEAKDLTTMRWRVEVLPYNNLNIPVNVFTSFVVSKLAGNLRKYFLNPKLYADTKKKETTTTTTTESVAAKALTWVQATKTTIEDLQNKAFQSMVEKKSLDIDKSLAYFVEEAKAVEMSYGDGASVGRPTYSLGKGFDYADYVYDDDIEADDMDSIFRGTYSLGPDDEEDERWRPTRSIAD